MDYLPVFVAAAVLAAGTSLPVVAQQEDRPTLTIVRFEGSVKAPRGTPDAAGELADALATRVQESGCCRVMLRAWLQQSTGADDPGLSTVRASAAAARVEYVVAGRVAKTRVVRRPSVPSIPSMVGPTAPSALPFPPGAVRGRATPRMPLVMAMRPTMVSMVTLEMRILDPATGNVLRTVKVEKEALSDDLSLVTNSPDVSDTLVRALATLARERR